jgi:hypothetical protein
MTYFSNDYCNRKLWICISFGTIFIACCTLILLIFYHYQRRSRTTKIPAQNFNENMLKIPKRNRMKTNLDQQIEELLRLTPIIPFEQIKLNEFNRITIIPSAQIN